MSQFKNFKFGVDYIAFVDSQYNVYALNDPQKASLNLTYEVTEHRGGSNNDLRKVAIHSRSGEFSLSTGYADINLAQLLTGGTVTSRGTSTASIVTGTATGVNTLYGTAATICTAILSTVINSATVLKSSDYYLTASDFAKITVARVFDGKEYSAITLTSSSVVPIADGALSVHVGTAGGSLTVGEKAYITARSAINSMNQTVKFDSNKPSSMSAVVTVDFDGFRQTINIPNVQPQGTIQGSSATEFQVQDLTMKIFNSDVLDQIANIVIQG